MELKKNPKVDLRRYSGLFLEVGFVVAVGVVLLAFSYTVHEKNTAGFGELEDVVAEEEIIPITRQQEITPPPPPEVPKVAEVINIVDDDVDIDDELDIEDVEADQDTEVAIVEVAEEEEEEEEQVFFIVENMPEFPGGDVALRKYLAQNVVYPEIAKDLPDKFWKYYRMYQDQQITISECAKMLGCTRPTVYKYISLVEKSSQ